MHDFHKFFPMIFVIVTSLYLVMPKKWFDGKKGHYKLSDDFQKNEIPYEIQQYSILETYERQYPGTQDKAFEELKSHLEQISIKERLNQKKKSTGVKINFSNMKRISRVGDLSFREKRQV